MTGRQYLSLGCDLLPPAGGFKRRGFTGILPLNAVMAGTQPSIKGRIPHDVFSQCQSQNAEEWTEAAAAAAGLCTVTLPRSDTATAEEDDGRGSPRGTTMSEINPFVSTKQQNSLQNQKNRHQPGRDAERCILPRATGFKGCSSCIHLTS